MSKNNSLYWELDDKGVLAVSVKGHMPDFYEGKSRMPWYDVRNQIDTIIFREGILSIGAQAFKDCKALTYVEIPESLEHIGYGAFEGCVALDCVDFPDRRVLKHQQSPNQEIRISEKRVTMERRAFLFTPWAKQELGDFIGEDGLLIEYYGDDKNVVIPEGIEVIDSFVFRKHPIESVQFPYSLKVIGACAFEGTNLTQVMLPDRLEEVKLGAFSNIPALEQVYFKNADTKIHQTAFKGSGNETFKLLGHNPSSARTFCKENGIKYETNHRFVPRFRNIPLVDGRPDVEFFMKCMKRRHLILGIFVNEKEKTVELVTSYKINIMTLVKETYYSFAERRTRTLAQHFLFPEKGGARRYTKYKGDISYKDMDYLVRKYNYLFSKEKALYLENKEKGGDYLNHIHSEWYLSWETGKSSGAVEEAFLEEWLSLHPGYGRAS